MIIPKLIQRKPSSERNYRGWSLSYKPTRKPKSEGKYDCYWYASRKIEDRVISIYVGKNIKDAPEKIEAWLKWNDDSYNWETDPEIQEFCEGLRKIEDMLESLNFVLAQPSTWRIMAAKIYFAEKFGGETKAKIWKKDISRMLKGIALSKWEWKTIGKVLGLGTTKKAIWESLRLIDNPKTKKRKKERRDE